MAGALSGAVPRAAPGPSLTERSGPTVSLVPSSTWRGAAVPRLRRGAASAVGRDHRSVFCRAKGDAWRSALYTGMWEASMEEDFLVEEAMNPDVVLLPEGSSVRNATHEFVTHNISGAPVVAADGQVRGVLCKSDLTVPFMAPDGREIQINAMHIPFMENRSKEMLEAFEQVLDQPVEAYMVRDPLLVPPTMTISKAMALMVEHHVNRLPVVENGEVVGILTRYDILRALTRIAAPGSKDGAVL